MNRERAELPAGFVLPARLVHGICHYHRQWILGDERGFRSRDHRIHSSGDYRNPPPAEEHAGLRLWVKDQMNGDPVRLSDEQCAVVGAAFVAKLHRMGCEVIVLACGPTHLHAMFGPTEVDVVRQLGKAKQFSSLKCPNRTGQLWAELSEVIEVRGNPHAHEVFAYIDEHRQEGAWIWRVDLNGPARRV